MSYNCNWILALTSVCLVGLAGWSATRPDACEEMTLTFHNGTLHSCLTVTETGLARRGSVDDCPNECDAHHHQAASEGAGRRLGTTMLQATSTKPCDGTCSSGCSLSLGQFCGVLSGADAGTNKPSCQTPSGTPTPWAEPTSASSGGFPTNNLFGWGGCNGCAKWTCPDMPPVFAECSNLAMTVCTQNEKCKIGPIKYDRMGCMPNNPMYCSYLSSIYDTTECDYAYGDAQ